jgi:hypothetical protein
VTKESCEKACDATHWGSFGSGGVSQPGEGRSIVCACQDAVASRRNPLAWQLLEGRVLKDHVYLADGYPELDEDGKKFQNVDVELGWVNVGLPEILDVVPTHMFV